MSADNKNKKEKEVLSKFLFNGHEKKIPTLVVFGIIAYIAIMVTTIKKGFVPINDTFKSWGLFIPLSFMLMKHVARLMGMGPSVTRGGSRLSDVMVFMIISLICVSYLAFVGIVANLRLYSGWDYGNAFEDKIFGRSPLIEQHYLVVMFVYQGWLLLYALINKEYRTPEYILHHTCALFCTVVGFMPFVQFYTLFSGVAELTNVFLTGVEVFQYLGDSYKNKFLGFYNFCLYSFGLSFYVIRLIMWPIIGFDYFKKSVELLFNDSWIPDDNFCRFESESTRVTCGKSIVAFMTLSSLALTLLQFYWGYLIYAKMTKKKPSKDE